MTELLALFEAMVMATIAELALIVIVLLICRTTGTKVPAWVRPAWLRDRINGAIEPDERRFEALAKMA